MFNMIRGEVKYKRRRMCRDLEANVTTRDRQVGTRLDIADCEADSLCTDTAQRQHSAPSPRSSHMSGTGEVQRQTQTETKTKTETETEARAHFGRVRGSVVSQGVPVESCGDSTVATVENQHGHVCGRC